MATDTTARIESLQAQIAKRTAWNAKRIAAAEEAEAKIAAGKAKADGPKAKFAASEREAARFGEWEIVRLQTQLDVLTKPVEELTPEGVDTVIFTIGADIWQRTQYLLSSRDSVAQTIWPEAWKARNPKPYARPHRMLPYELERTMERIAGLEAEIEALEAEVAPYKARYRAERWTRYILCGNNNGHLHYEGCHTLRYDTQVLWVAQASGLDASEVVGRFGTVACSKCFPGAPV